MAKYRCDEPMADRWRIRGRCNRKCVECLCAIRMDGSGKETHVADYLQGECSNVTARNIRFMNGRGYAR